MAFGGSGGSGKVKSDINVTPLVDVVLVLLIIFLVAMPVVMRNITVDIPRTLDQPEQVDIPDQVTVEIAKGGAVLLNGREIDRVDLASKLRDKLEHKRDKVVFVDFDFLTRYGDAVSVMDTCRGAGAITVGLKIKDKDPATGAPTSAPAATAPVTPPQ